MTNPSLEGKSETRALIQPGSVSQEELDRIDEVLRERDELEVKCELLAHTKDSVEFFGVCSEYQSSRLLFRQNLGRLPVESAIRNWINEIANRSPNTAMSYDFAMRRLEQIGAIAFKRADGEPFTLDDFREVRHERIVDAIKCYSEWAEDTRQARAASYISFTSWLSRLSEGWIREAKPQASGTGKTFYKTKDKVATEALSIQECYRLLDAVTEINERDGLIAKAAFGGARRISEVLEIELPSVNLGKCTITYRISKNKGTLREISITYGEAFIADLKSHIDSTSEHRGNSSLLFITRKGNAVVRQRLNDTFTQASKNLGWLKFCEKSKKWAGRKASPHTLRTSWITYAREQGFGADDIGEVTGQSTGTVRSYDKRGVEENISKRLQVV